MKEQQWEEVIHKGRKWENLKEEEKAQNLCLCSWINCSRYRKVTTYCTHL
jgi:hypothetical protein